VQRFSALILFLFFGGIALGGYSLAPLATPIGAYDHLATGLSESAHVSGIAFEIESPTQVPVAWGMDGSALQLAGPPGYSSAYALGVIDESGHTIHFGQFSNPGEPYPKPALWRDGVFSTLPFDGAGGYVQGGNGTTFVGATFLDPPVPQQTVLTIWQDGMPQRVNGVSAEVHFLRPFSMNRAGEYVGVYLNIVNDDFVYGSFIGQGTEARFLSWTGFPEARSYDINDVGQVVGFYLPDGVNPIGFVATEDEAQSLGILDGSTYNAGSAINNFGTIAGYNLDAFGNSVGVLYEPGSLSPIDLNTLIDPIPGVKLVRGVDINNAGQILVEGLGASGYSYYVLTPIPEPVCLAMVVMAVAGSMNRPRRGG